MNRQKAGYLAETHGMNQREIGNLIKERRELRGLTQRELAEMVGCDYRTLSAVENGHNRASKKLYDRIAQVLGINFSLDFPLEK